MDNYDLPPAERQSQDLRDVEFEPRIYPDLVEKYRTFRNTLNPKCDVVYHPCSAEDVSPSFAFPESEIIYVDINPLSVQALTKHGYNAIVADAMTYVPEKPVDVLILLNPSIESAGPAKHLEDGGYILCNDYHGNATELKNNENFELVGVLVKDKDGMTKIDSENLEDYWRKVETEDELKKSSISITNLGYEQMKKIIADFGGDPSLGVLDEYTRLYQEGVESRKKFAESFEDSEFIRDFLNDPNVTLVKGGRTYVLTPLPPKKGSVDSVYIFRKKKSYRVLV